MNDRPVTAGLALNNPKLYPEISHQAAKTTKIQNTDYRLLTINSLAEIALEDN